MTSVRAAERSRASRQHVIAGLVAGVAAAVVEMIPVLTIQSVLGVSPLRVFQSIAGGVLGSATYAGGWATAFLGLVFHVLISLVAGLMFAIVVALKPGLLARPVLAATAVGLFSYLVMTFVVLPLSAVPFPANRNPLMMGVSLVTHIVAFGLPIVLTCRSLLRSVSLAGPVGSGPD